MTQLAKGMVVLSSIDSPLGPRARIIYAGRGELALFGKTLFDVFIDDMSYGFFTLNGDITTLEKAKSRLLAPKWKDCEETVAQHAVSYQYVHADEIEGYGAE